MGAEKTRVAKNAIAISPDVTNSFMISYQSISKTPGLEKSHMVLKKPPHGWLFFTAVIPIKAGVKV